MSWGYGKKGSKNTINIKGEKEFTSLKAQQSMTKVQANLVSNEELFVLGFL